MSQETPKVTKINRLGAILFLFLVAGQFLVGCASNVMHNYIVDDKENSHIYLSDKIYNNSIHWCFRHDRMENIRIKNPVVSTGKAKAR